MTTAPQYRRHPTTPQPPRRVHPADLERVAIASPRPLTLGLDLIPEDQTRALRYCDGTEPVTQWLACHVFLTNQNGRLDRRSPGPAAVLDPDAARR